MKVEEVIGAANALGACDKSSKVSDWKSLIWLFFTPQGREFCEQNNFPSLEVFREMKTHVREYKTYVEENIKAHNEDAALIGESESELSFSGTDKVYKVIVMHGAKVHIKARNYAVVLIADMGGILTIDKDETVKILK